MKKTFCVILFTLIGLAAKAQDPQFSQFYAAPLLLNPGFTGTTEMHRFNVIGRVQWANVPNPYKTMAASYDYNMAKLNSGFGILLMRDQAGDGNLSRTTAGGHYAYKIRTRSGWTVSPGLQFGYVLGSIDPKQYYFPFEAQYGSDNIDYDPIQLNETKGYFDFGTGLLVYNKLAWGGVSVYHLNEPNESLVDGEAKVNAKWSAHGGVRINLYNGPMKKDRISSIAPSFIYKKQGKAQQLDLGLHFHYNPIMAGFWYRGVVVRDEFELPRQDAVSFLFGIRMPTFDVGYSYDFTISSLGAGSGGSHEVSLVYQLKTAESRKVKRKEKFIPCPTF